MFVLISYIKYACMSIQLSLTGLGHDDYLMLSFSVSFFQELT